MQRRTWILAGLATTLGACGWRLRGANRSINYPLLVAGSPGPVARALVQQLRQSQSNVALLGSNGPAPTRGDRYTLLVLQDQRVRSIQGTNSTGQVREIKLLLQFRWSLVDPEGQEVLAPRSITFEQDLSFSESQALGKEQEEEAIFQTLQARAIDNTVSQLTRIKP